MRSSIMHRLIVLLIFLAGIAFTQDDVDPATTLTSIGQIVPDFTITATDGTVYSSKNLKAEVYVLDFFATWCAPCLEAMPHLQSKVWETYRDRGLLLLGIGREHTSQELAYFVKDKGYTFPVAADPKRSIYSKFASMYIPRTYLIGRDGTILYQSVGFDEEEFNRLLAAVKGAF